MDGLQSLKNVLVIGATNRPDILDPALMRAGRFDRVVEIPVPDEATRLEILKVHTRKMPLSKPVDLKELSHKTDGYTGADIENLCREAGMEAIRRLTPKAAADSGDWSKAMGDDGALVGPSDFESAAKRIKPSFGKADVERIKKFASDHGDTMYR
jgi:transitional endoplasmic reticulum ATPase